MAANMQVSIRAKVEDDYMQDTMASERVRQQTHCKDANGGIHGDKKVTMRHDRNNKLKGESEWVNEIVRQH